MAERKLWDRLRPPRDPRARGRAEAREEPRNLRRGDREELRVGRARECPVESSAEKRRRENEAFGRPPGEERGRIEDAEGAESLHLRDEPAEPVRSVLRRNRRAIGLHDNGDGRGRYESEGGGRARQDAVEELGVRRSRERRHEDVGVESPPVGGAHGPTAAWRAGCARPFDRDDGRVQLQTVAGSLAQAALKGFDEREEAAVEGESSRSMARGSRRAAFLFFLSKKSSYDASGCALRLPEAGERRAHRKRAGIGRVDAGHHRPRAVNRRLLAEAPREEGVDALVLERRGPRRDEGLLEEAQLPFRREDLLKSAAGPGTTARGEPPRTIQRGALASAATASGSRPRSARRRSAASLVRSVFGPHSSVNPSSRIVRIEPPARGPASRTVVSPALARRNAAVRPAIPAPRTTTRVTGPPSRRRPRDPG